MKLNDVAVTPHMSLLPRVTATSGRAFRAPHYAKVEHGGRKSEARLWRRESDQLPRSSHVRPLRPPGPPSMNLRAIAGRQEKPVSRLLSTLATIWRLASPYFVSEDRWAGRILLGAVIAIELSIVGDQRHAQSVEQPVLQRAAGAQLGQLRLASCCSSACWPAAFIVLAVYQLYLNQWLQIRWRRWMTGAVSRPLARRRQPLPHAAPRRRRRQPRPAHRRGHQAVHRAHADDRVGLLSAIVTLGLVRRHPVDAVGGCPAPSVRHEPRHSGLSGLGRVALCDRRDLR